MRFTQAHFAATMSAMKWLIVFFISMLPLVELRGAIPVSQGLGLNPMISYVVCIVGNMIPVPFIYLFARRFLQWGCGKPLIGGVCEFFCTKGARAGEKLEAKAGKGLFLALALFVGIPLPGTGAWTGTLAASFLNMRFRQTVAAVMAGSMGFFAALFALVRGGQ